MNSLKEKMLETELTDQQLGIFYLGQMGFLLKYRKCYFLIDGYLSDYVDRNCSQLVKWVRRYPAPLKGEDLDFVDYVFCTHGHYDHADPDTLSAIGRVNKKARFIVPNSVVTTVESYGIPSERIMGVPTDKMFSLGEDVSFYAVPSAHEELHPDGNGGYEEVGYRLVFGDISLYHSGDCCIYDGLTDWVRNTDIMMLPVNGRDYYRRYRDDIIGCFDSVEALTLARDAGTDLLIPTHFDLYDVNAVNPAWFVDAQQKINPRQKYHIFMPGELYIYCK